MLDEYLPRRVNQGPWITAYTLDALCQRDVDQFVLPICSIDTPYERCAALGQCVLPPLFHEALDDSLKAAVIARITECFPIHGGDNASRLRVVELPRSERLTTQPPDQVLAFSVDTAVEEHGPHLPLATDTIQSYSVLDALQRNNEMLDVCRPLEYGQLTWGLPFGFSIDLTADLLTPYVSAYVNALVAWKAPRALYVVDVHGSISHRSAIVEGLKASGFPTWTFRWLHEPLAEFASARGDQHAGGVETALVERVSRQLLDDTWWPSRIEEIAAGQLSFDEAVRLTPDLSALTRRVRDDSLNGVVGDIRNYHTIDADELFSRMLSVAQNDVEQLIGGTSMQDAGEELW